VADFDRDIVAFLWDRAEVIGSVPAGADDPTPDQLDALADAWTERGDGVRPEVRVLAPAFVSTTPPEEYPPDPTIDWPGWYVA
jgi:hypothetical protein